MKYVLFATPRFGALVLERLVQNGMPPVAVVAKPDRPVGRKGIVTPPPVKVKALELGIPVLQPERLPDIYDELRVLNADFFLVASYGKIFRPELLAIPTKGMVGVHPSLLPLYRGTSPIQNAIMDGTPETGVSLFVMDAEVDHGPVIAADRIALDGTETYLELEERLAHVGADLASRALPAWVAGEIVPVEQNHATAAFTSKITTQDGYVAWEDVEKAIQGNLVLAERIRRGIAGLTPEPGVWTERNGDRIKLLAARIGEKGLEVTRYQRAGKTPQDALLV